MKKDSAALLSIFSNTILIVLKLYAGVIVCSVSIISEAIHSSMDLLASFIAYFSIKAASKKEDKEHPFGHGKFENLSGFAEANLIIFAAFLIILESGKKLIYGVEIENVNLGIAVMLFAALINLVISLCILKISKRTNSLALEADAYHLLTDAFTSLGVFLGLIIVKFTTLTIFDPITALIVSLIIIRTGISLIKKSSKDLLDSSLSNEDLDKINEVLVHLKEEIKYHSLKTRNNGNKQEILIQITLENDLSLIEAHKLCDKIEQRIKKEFPESYIMIHMEPQTK